MASISSSTVPEKFLSDPLGWLATMAKENKLETLLAYSEKGIQWGRLEGETILLASDAYPAFQPDFDLSKLQELRLFGEQAELHIWQTSNMSFYYSLLIESDSLGEFMDDAYLLWGAGLAEPSPQNGFTLFQVGRQKFHHAPPISNGTGKHAKLHVRHYLDQDDDGQVHVKFSRLLKLECID